MGGNHAKPEMQPTVQARIGVEVHDLNELYEQVPEMNEAPRYRNAAVDLLRCRMIEPVDSTPKSRPVAFQVRGAGAIEVNGSYDEGPQIDGVTSYVQGDVGLRYIKSGLRNARWYFIRLSSDVNLYRDGLYWSETEQHVPPRDGWKCEGCRDGFPPLPTLLPQYRSRVVTCLSQQQEDGTSKISCINLSGEEVVAVAVDQPGQNVASLRGRLVKQLDCPPEELRLLDLNGLVLRDHMILSNLRSCEAKHLHPRCD